MRTINAFTGDYEFLHNYFPHPVQYEGILYPTNEHAFQAAKTLDVALRKKIASCETPGKAKALGNRIPIRSDWEAVKTGIMEELCRLKFSDPILKERLIATVGCYLIVGNHWGDTCWGMVNGNGENRLGKILMTLRDDIIQNECNLRSLDDILQDVYSRTVPTGIIAPSISHSTTPNHER